MNKHLIAKAGILGLVFGVAGVSAAQSNGPKGLSIRIGAQFPRDGDTGFGLGLDYKFREIAVPQARGDYASYLGASIDYYGKDGDNYNVPFAVTYNVRNNDIVFSAGVGWDFFRHRNESDNGFGAQIGVAYEFGLASSGTGGGTPLFVQAKYYFANEADRSGLALYLGYRF